MATATTCCAAPAAPTSSSATAATTSWPARPATTPSTAARATTSSRAPATGLPADAGAGADDIHGGAGSDRLSYLDHTAGVSVSLDDKAGDGTSGENDNAHGDIETLVGSTFDDMLVGNDGAQSLFGNAGIDRVDGLGGDDVVNGGTGDDELYGGAGDDRVEGSAGGDYLEGGAGEDIFEGDNVCETEPCTGDSDFIQARDGQADTVNCGVGADTAIVDSLDVVAQDTQHGCERIDRSAAEGVTPPAGAVLGATTGLGVPKVSVLGARKLGRLRRGKLSIKVTCPGSCRVKARLISGRTVVASRSRTRLGAGTVIVRPKATKKGRKLIKRRSKAHDDAGRRRDRRPGPHHDPGPGPPLPPLVTDLLTVGRAAVPAARATPTRIVRGVGYFVVC